MKHKRQDLNQVRSEKCRSIKSWQKHKQKPLPPDKAKPASDRAMTHKMSPVTSVKRMVTMRPPWSPIA